MVRWLLLSTVLCTVSGQGEPATRSVPWDLGTLDAAPKWTFLERPKLEGVRALTFEGVPYRGKPTRVFAWLGLPTVSPGEKVPAMVLVHGGGGTAFEEWVRLWLGRGYAAIAMDTCGQIPAGHYGRWFRDEQGGPPGWGGFDQLDQPRTDQWTYHAVADIILAHSLIRSLPEVDPERTGVTGISWGGYLTCIVAGVDPRFKLAVPVYGCGFYPDTVFANNLDKLEPSAAARWLESWDPSVYLPEAAMPILWVNGSNDFAYPLGAMQRSYRLPLGPRTLCIRLRMPHGHGGAGENPEEIRIFTDSVLKGGKPLARITGSGREGASAWASYVSPVPVARAELNITRDTGRWQDRRWEALPATLADGRMSAPLPENTRVYYFNLFDERDCVVSTEHEVVATDSAPALVFHVAADGDDAHPGTEAQPFRTLERARDAIRAVKQRDALPAGGVEVQIHPGEYRVTQTFRLGAEDSGTAAAPVTYRAVEGGAPRFTGGVRLSSFAVVEDAVVLARLPESARGHVWSTDLAKAGVTEVIPFALGGFASGRGFRTHPAMELYVNGEAMTLARWPNEGFVKTGEVPGPLTLTAWDRRPGAPEGRFRFDGDRPARWVEEPDAWLYGYWFWDWADSYEKIERIDLDRREIVLAKPWHGYGYRQGQRYHAVNLLSELDAPGEWYLDRQRQRVFLFPPGDLSEAVVELSVAGFPFVRVEVAAHVRFQGLVWECGAADGIHIIGGESVSLEGCTVRKMAGTGVEIRGGQRHAVQSCDISNLGRGGIAMAGGDRRTLTPGAHRVENCHIHHLSRIDHTYTPGVWLDGVGNRIRHNLIHHVASSAMRIEGNDHLIEFNEAHRVVLESDDQGAVDMFGNATYRGNVYRYNYWHHLGNWDRKGDEAHPMRAGIRLDDAICGVLVYGNVFQRCATGGTHFGGVQIHGGKENVIAANLFVDNAAAVSFTPWGEKRWREFVAKALDAPAVDRELYLARYPALAQLAEGHDVNAIQGNVALRCGPLFLRAPAGTEARHNREYPQGAELPEGPDGRLVWSADAAERLGVAHIPFLEIGLYADAWRGRVVSERLRVQSGGEWSSR